MLNTNIAEGRGKLRNNRTIIINKDVLLMALSIMKASFGDNIVCTLLYHVGRALGSAILNMYIGNNSSLKTIIERVLQEAKDMGLIELTEASVEDGVIRILVDPDIDRICNRNSPPYPLFRGLINGLFKNLKPTLIDVREKDGYVELYFLIDEEYKWW